jgi:hypothetical protein
MTSPWNSSPIAAPWRQGLCGGITAVAVAAVAWIPTSFARPDAQSDASPDVTNVTPSTKNESVPTEFRMVSLPSRMAAFTVDTKGTGLVPTDVPHSIAPDKPADSKAVPVSPTSFRMADGDAFPLVISIPAGPAWREVFQRYGGAIGVSNSSSPRPAYLNHTISPDGRIDQESVPTTGRFLFRLSEEAIQVVNDTVEPAAKIPPGHAAFGVFEGPFRSVVARVLQDFCVTEHVNPDDLTGVQLELGPGFGLRVASTTRRAGKS